MSNTSTDHNEGLPDGSTPFLVTRNRHSFLYTLIVLGTVTLFLAVVVNVPLRTVLTVATGYAIACLIAGVLLLIRDSWFQENEDLFGELTDRHLSLHWNSTGVWTVLNRRGRELSCDKNWNTAMKLALDYYDNGSMTL